MSLQPKLPAPAEMVASAMVPPTWCPACFIEHRRSVALECVGERPRETAFRCPDCTARYVVFKGR